MDLVKERIGRRPAVNVEYMSGPHAVYNYGLVSQIHGRIWDAHSHIYLLADH
jgi:hypothetical protein